MDKSSNRALRFLIIPVWLLVFVGLSIVVPTLFKRFPFLTLPLLGLAVVFLIQSLRRDP